MERQTVLNQLKKFINQQVFFESSNFNQWKEIKNIFEC